MARSKGDESRAGVPARNLDQLFDGAGATKRDLVDYLDGILDRITSPSWASALSSDQGDLEDPSTVHAEERSQVHPGLGGDGSV